MTEYSFTTTVDEHRVRAIEEAIGYVHRRLIGRLPRVLDELCTQLTDAFWDRAAAAGGAIRIVGGGPAASAFRASNRAGEQARAPELTVCDASAEDSREDEFWRFEEAHRDETEHAYRAWLEEQAAEFVRARGRWRAERRASLRAAFAETEGADRV